MLRPRERSIIGRLLSLKWSAQITFGHNLSTKVGVCGVNVCGCEGVYVYICEGVYVCVCGWWFVKKGQLMDNVLF